MSEHDLPGEGTVSDDSRTFDEGVDDLTDLLGDPETDLSEGDQGNEQAKAQAEPEGDEPDGEDSDEADPDEEGVEQDEGDGSGDYAGGKFAADNAKVRLDDGTTITIAELKRNNLFQRDYTRKTTELSDQRKQFEETRERVSQAAEQLAQQRDFLLQVYQQILPQQPDPSMMETDFVGYIQQKDTYERRMAELNQLRQFSAQEQQRLQSETEQQKQQRLAEERNRMLEVMPDLKDPAKFDAFRGDILKYGVEEYGLTPDELSSIEDHRYLRVLRKAIAYDKLRAKAPQAREALQGKPKLTQSRRMDPKAKTSREAQARAQQLAKTGDFDAGVRALMDLDL